MKTYINSYCRYTKGTGKCCLECAPPISTGKLFLDLLML
jgi:hypothetical protein